MTPVAAATHPSVRDAPMIPATTIVLLVGCAVAWVWTEVEMRRTDRRR